MAKQNQDLNNKSRSWLEAIAVVAFHVEHGQIIENVFMFNGEKTLKEAIKQKLLALSLPDSNSGQNGDVQYIFRIRVNDQQNINTCRQSDFMYACAFFRQIKNESYARGYFQKSVVLLSKYPYASFLNEGAFVIGPIYFEYGAGVMPAIINNVQEWPPPKPGNTYNLNLAGCDISVTIPFTEQSLEMANSVDSYKLSHLSPRDGGFTPRRQTFNGINADTVDRRFSFASSAYVDDKKEGATRKERISSFTVDESGDSTGLYQDVQLFATFGGLSVALWHLWEIALCGHPLLILASTPDVCSQAVLAVASLIAPLNYHGDYRPYFTIYDSDFMHINKQHNQLHGENMPPYIIGVTNPYFLKTFEFWPNMISMGGGAMGPSSVVVSHVPFLNRRDDESTEDDDAPRPTPRTMARASSSYLQRRRNLGAFATDIHAAKYNPTVAKRSSSLDAILSEQKYENSVVLTRDRPLVVPDRTILRQLLPTNGTQDASFENYANYAIVDANNIILRDHFRGLTLLFLQPLEEYLTLASVGSRFARRSGYSLAAYKEVPMLDAQFDVESFLEDIESNMDLLPPEIQKMEWRELYRRFAAGPNFEPWYTMQRSKLESTLRGIYRHLRMNLESGSILQQVGATASEMNALASQLEMRYADCVAEELDKPARRTQAMNMHENILKALESEKRKPEPVRDQELCKRMEEHLAICKSYLANLEVA